MDASFRRRPQAHLVLSGSGFDLCNDVILDLYNEPEANFAAWYTRFPRIRDIQVFVKAASATGIQLGEQALEVAQALGAVGVLERLVLGQDVDETLAHFVAMPPEELPAGVSECADDVGDPAVRPKLLRHGRAPAVPVGQQAEQAERALPGAAEAEPPS